MAIVLDEIVAEPDPGKGYTDPTVVTVARIRHHGNYWNPVKRGGGWEVLWDRFAHWRNDEFPIPPLEEICMLASQALKEE